MYDVLKDVQRLRLFLLRRGGLRDGQPVRYIGLKARITTICGHVVPEIEWDGQWHLLDASLVNFFVLKDQPPVQ